MAFYLPARIGFAVRDANGRTGNFQIYCSVDFDISLATTINDIYAFAENLKPIVAGKIQSIYFAYSIELATPVNDPATADCDIENVGKLRFIPGTTGRPPMSIDIPAVEKSLFVNKTLIRTNPQTEQLIADLAAGHGSILFHDPWNMPYDLFSDGVLTRHKGR